MVAPDKLGVINHARLTKEAIEADGFDVVAVVLNQGQERPQDASRATNHEDLTVWLNVPIVCPYYGHEYGHILGTLCAYSASEP